MGMTSEDKKRFESQWPQVAARLGSMLARRGVPADRREDIVQETGLKLLKTWDRVDASKPLWPFTVTIALNLMRDQARKGLYTEVPAEIPDRSNNEDVEEVNLARLELRRAGLALAQMDPGQREVLLAEIEPTPHTRSSASPAATKMLRMRARRKLSLLMQQVSALALVPVAATKRLGRLAHLFPYSKATEGAVTSALCGVLCVVALGGSVGLAPFSSLPSDAFRHDAGGRGSSSEVRGSISTPYLSAAPGARTQGGSTSSLRDAIKELRSPQAGDPSATKGPAVSEADDSTLKHESGYEIPVGGKTLAQGKVGLEVFGGGHGPSAPSNVDCHERMFSPNEINATCWDQSNPDRRYGVRVRHEGKTTVDHLLDH